MPTVSQVWIGRPLRRNIRTSSAHARPLAATTSIWNIHAGAPAVTQPTAGLSTTALAMRLQTAGPPSTASRTVKPATSVLPTSHLSESARPPLELAHRAIEIAGPEIRPEGRRDHQLSVGNLPQEKVRDPHLAARADQQVGIGNVRGIEGPADILLRDVVSLEVASLNLARQRAERVEQLVAAPVVERHQHGQPGVVPRLVHHVIDAPTDAGWHSVRPAEDTEPSVARHQRGKLRVDRALEDIHEGRDLVQRTAPVLRRDRVEREVAVPDRVVL